MCAGCDSARERDRNRQFRFSPEVKTETEPKVGLANFLAPSVFGILVSGIPLENLNAENALMNL